MQLWEQISEPFWLASEPLLVPEDGNSSEGLRADCNRLLLVNRLKRALRGVECKAPRYCKGSARREEASMDGTGLSDDLLSGLLGFLGCLL